MKIFWMLFLALLFLHQDFWNWSSEEMVWGGVPIGLFYHALFLWHAPGWEHGRYCGLGQVTGSSMQRMKVSKKSKV